MNRSLPDTQRSDGTGWHCPDVPTPSPKGNDGILTRVSGDCSERKEYNNIFVAARRSLGQQGPWGEQGAGVRQSWTSWLVRGLPTVAGCAAQEATTAGGQPLSGIRVPPQVHTELLCEQTTEPLCPGERGLCVPPTLLPARGWTSERPIHGPSQPPALKQAVASNSMGPRHPRERDPQPSAHLGQRESITPSHLPPFHLAGNPSSRGPRG